MKILTLKEHTRLIHSVQDVLQTQLDHFRGPGIQENTFYHVVMVHLWRYKNFKVTPKPFTLKRNCNI